MKAIITRFVEQLGSEINYIYRCTAVMLLDCALSNHALEKADLNELFAALTQKFMDKEEKVPNVLIYYFDLYNKNKAQLNQQGKKEFTNFARKVKETIADEDVLYYLQQSEQ